MLLWFIAILVAAGAVWGLLTITEVTDASTSLIAVAWTLILLALAVDIWTRSKRRSRYRQRFPTLDDLHGSVDAEALRAVRDRDGEIPAVRQLRRSFPEVPLADAVKVVRGL
jgi:hypothetical protein